MSYSSASFHDATAVAGMLTKMKKNLRLYENNENNVDDYAYIYPFKIFYLIPHSAGKDSHGYLVWLEAFI